MGVIYITTNKNVNRYRHIHFMTRSKNRCLGTRPLVVVQMRPDRAACPSSAESAGPARVRNNVIQIRRLFPETKLTIIDILLHILASSSVRIQFKVMNSAGPVSSHMIDISVQDKISDVSSKPQLD